jgi:DNA-binding transcriptional regulator of glucitol operon
LAALGPGRATDVDLARRREALTHMLAALIFLIVTAVLAAAALLSGFRIVRFKDAFASLHR